MVGAPSTPPQPKAADAEPIVGAALGVAAARSPTIRPSPARIAAPTRPWRGLDTTVPGASLQARPFDARERAVLAGRAHHLALGEEPALIPWHDAALDARALAWAHALAAQGQPDAWAEAARLIELVHADAASRDDEATVELALAKAWRQRAGAAADRRPTLRTGALLWNGRRVRLGWRDRVDTVNPLWIDVHQPRWQGLTGRYEAAAAAAARLSAAGDVLLLTTGTGAAREAERWLAADGHDRPTTSVRDVTVRDAAALFADAAAASTVLGRCTTWILAGPLDDELRLDGTFATWLAAFARAAVAAEVRVLVGVDLRPEQARVQRELRAAAMNLDTAEAAWHHLGGDSTHAADTQDDAKTSDSLNDAKEPR